MHVCMHAETFQQGVVIHDAIFAFSMYRIWQMFLSVETEVLCSLYQTSLVQVGQSLRILLS